MKTHFEQTLFSARLSVIELLINKIHDGDGW